VKLANLRIDGRCRYSRGPAGKKRGFARTHATDWVLSKERTVMSGERKSKYYAWLIVALIITFGFVSLLFFRFVLTKETSKKKCEGREIAMFRTQLALIPSSDTVEKQRIEGKVQAWETMIAICEKITPETGVPKVTPTFIQWTAAPFETGIFEGQTGIFHSFEAKIENHWKGIVDGKRVIVFAGVWVNDPGQGFIAVETMPDKGHPAWSYYPSATKSGALRILEARGSRLIIQSVNHKNLLYFDVPALTYVSSLQVTAYPSTPTAAPSTAQPVSTLYPYP
jgi:hypothetical protein